MVHEEQEVIFTVGLPASGKSSWAKEFVQEHPDYVRVSRDDLRRMRGTYWLPEQEDFITILENQSIIAALRNNLSVVIDATNLSVKRVEDRIKMLRIEVLQDFKVSYKYFDTPIAECIHRDKGREFPVGTKVIKNMSRNIKGILPVFVKNGRTPNLPDAVIFDLDGTLATMGERSPFDWHRVDEDAVNEPVRMILDRFIDDHEVIIITGRDHEAKTKTLKWLDNHKIFFDQIHFREAGLHIKDTIVKKAIYDEQVKDKYNVRFVFDDRNSVVDMWRRELGLTCFSPNYGDF